MKVAVTATGPSLDAALDPRFGRCPCFVLVETDDMTFETVENGNSSLGGGAGIQSARLMAQKGVKAVLTGNCGPNAHETLTRRWHRRRGRLQRHRLRGGRPLRVGSTPCRVRTQCREPLGHGRRTAVSRPIRIAVASGKGGTGKTTIATNLAVALAEAGVRVAYVDCDVEEPNGHIFLKPTIRTAPGGVDTRSRGGRVALHPVRCLRQGVSLLGDSGAAEEGPDLSQALPRLRRVHARLSRGRDSRGAASHRCRRGGRVGPGDLPAREAQRRRGHGAAGDPRGAGGRAERLHGRARRASGNVVPGDRVGQDRRRRAPGHRAHALRPQRPEAGRGDGARAGPALRRGRQPRRASATARCSTTARRNGSPCSSRYRTTAEIARAYSRGELAVTRCPT